MPSREEIREGIAKLCANGMRNCDYACKSCVELDRVLKDVMIRVDGELLTGKDYAGYVATELLIKEVKDGI